MKKEPSKRLTRNQRAELKALAALRDDAIDTSDAPELPGLVRRQTRSLTGRFRALSNSVDRINFLTRRHLGNSG